MLNHYLRGRDADAVSGPRRMASSPTYGAGYERLEHLGVGPRRHACCRKARASWCSGQADKAVMDSGRYRLDPRSTGQRCRRAAEVPRRDAETIRDGAVLESTATSGAAYNRAMELLPEDGWAAFQDHDAMLTTRRLVSRSSRRPSRSSPRPGAFCRDDEPHRGRPGSRSAIGTITTFGITVGSATERLKVRTLARHHAAPRASAASYFASRSTVWREVGGFVDGLLCVDHGMHFALQRAGRTVWLRRGNLSLSLAPGAAGTSSQTIPHARRTVHAAATK
jgi:hypothetical protein